MAKKGDQEIDSGRVACALLIQRQQNSLLFQGMPGVPLANDLADNNQFHPRASKGGDLHAESSDRARHSRVWMNRSTHSTFFNKCHKKMPLPALVPIKARA